jgi:glycine/D-amino acid oxidase-like deaminating enzyme
VAEPPAWRAAARRRLNLETFDVAIVGGGITGAGIARDAALRVLRVALFEANDFASGTSSRSSRLIHGGLRYLEHGHLHLVFESSRERRTLLRIAPHLVRPLASTGLYRGAASRARGFRSGSGCTTCSRCSAIPVVTSDSRARKCWSTSRACDRITSSEVPGTTTPPPMTRA